MNGDPVLFNRQPSLHKMSGGKMPISTVEHKDKSSLGGKPDNTARDLCLSVTNTYMARSIDLSPAFRGSLAMNFEVMRESVICEQHSSIEFSNGKVASNNPAIVTGHSAIAHTKSISAST